MSQTVETHEYLVEMLKHLKDQPDDVICSCVRSFNHLMFLDGIDIKQSCVRALMKVGLL